MQQTTCNPVLKSHPGDSPPWTAVSNNWYRLVPPQHPTVVARSIKQQPAYVCSVLHMGFDPSDVAHRLCPKSPNSVHKEANGIISLPSTLNRCSKIKACREQTSPLPTACLMHYTGPCRQLFSCILPSTHQVWDWTDRSVSDLLVESPKAGFIEFSNPMISIDLVLLAPNKIYFWDSTNQTIHPMMLHRLYSAPIDVPVPESI